MIGTRQWIARADSIEELKSRSVDTGDTGVIETLLTQGKKISHIISYIWLNKDPETAQKLDGYFKRGDDETLKKLLFADQPETKEYKLLLKVFKEEHLPIFRQNDKKYLNFRVATDKFEGNLGDPGPSDKAVLTVTIPYPPRPQISDDHNIISGAIQKSELEEWLNQAPNKSPYIYEKNPYIPASSS